MKADTLTVLVVEPEQPPYVKNIGDSLHSLQTEVGGSIEAIYPFDDPVAIICNEEGKLLGLPLNRALQQEPLRYRLSKSLSSFIYRCGQEWLGSCVLL